MERFQTILCRRVDDAGMEELAGSGHEACARAEREVVGQPDKYFGYAERVAKEMGGEGSVYLCRRSHKEDTLTDEAWTLRTLTS